MFKFGVENIGGQEQNERVNQAREIMTQAFDSCCNGELEERIKNNLDTNN